MVISCPPCAQRLELGFGEAVCDGKGESEFVAHGFDFVLGADRCGDDISAESFEFVETILVAT